MPDLPCQLLFPFLWNESPRCMGAHGQRAHPGQALHQGRSPVREYQLEEEDCCRGLQAPRSFCTMHSPFLRIELRHRLLSLDEDLR